MMHAIKRFTLGRTGKFYDVGAVVDFDDLTSSEIDHLVAFQLVKETEPCEEVIEKAKVQAEPEIEKVEKPKAKAKPKAKKAE